MNNKLKDLFRCIFVFIFVFFIYEFAAFYLTYDGDPIYSYGFGYAISRGMIPYKDFCLVTTPLYAFYISLGLNLFDNYIVVVFEQTLLVTCVFYLLYKMFGRKSYIYFLSTTLLNCYGILPTYNYMCFFFLILLMYMEEKYKDKDYLIGFIIGLSILTKHTVGIFFIIPTLIYYFKDKNKIFKRLIGCFIPLILFFLYLLFSKSLLQFIDYTIFGLFDFSKKNTNIFNVWFYFSIILLFISFFILFKDRKNIKNYYFFISILFLIPICNIHHFSIYFNCIILMIIQYVKKYDNYICYLSLGLSILLLFLYFRFFACTDISFQKYNDKFKYTLNYENDYKMNLNCFNFFNKYEDPLILSSNKMFYDISVNNKFDYFEILSYGNNGFNGSNKFINAIDNMHNKYIIVNMNDYNNNGSFSQFDKIVTGYVIDNYELIDSWNSFNVYFKL